MSIDQPSSKRGGNPVVKLFGAMLMAIGFLVAALCGLCSLGFIGLGFFSSFGQPNSAGALALVPVALLVGAIPVGFGVLLFIGGRSLYRDN
jgi:hypothetical protein